MIESILVMIPTLFVLVFILCLGFFMYQKWNIQITAYETANKIAELYPLEEVNLKKGAVNYSEVEGIRTYRYLNSDTLAENNQIRGEEYAKSYLSLVSFAHPKESPQIEVQTKHDAFCFRHVIVDVKGNYRLPFSEGFQVFGFKTNYLFTGHGEAVVTDLSDYFYTVNCAGNMENLLHLSDSHAYKLVNSVVKFISSIGAIIDNWPGAHEPPV